MILGLFGNVDDSFIKHRVILNFITNALYQHIQMIDQKKRNNVGGHLLKTVQQYIKQVYNFETRQQVQYEFVRYHFQTCIIKIVSYQYMR